MKKKVYQHPMMHIVMIQQAQLLSGSGKVSDVKGNSGLGYGGSGSGPPKLQRKKTSRTRKIGNVLELQGFLFGRMMIRPKLV